MQSTGINKPSFVHRLYGIFERTVLIDFHKIVYVKINSVANKLQLFHKFSNLRN